MGQTSHDRAIEQIAVTPSPGGPQDVTAVWRLAVESSTVPRSLTTEVVFERNGAEIASVIESVFVPGSLSCGDGPPCSGTCGSATLNGSSVSLVCYPDGPCDAICDCDCGLWISTEFPGQMVVSGDEITVLLRPASGSLPEGDTSNDALTMSYEGQPIGWNRGIDHVHAIATGPNTYDVNVYGSAGWEARAGFARLDFTLELSINGTTVASQNVPAQMDGIYDQSCFQNGCGSECGSFNGIPRWCDPYLWWSCGCVGGWISLFPGVEMSSGDEIAVILYPVPASLPELPGLADDDLFVLDCCDPVGVEGLELAEDSVLRLDQNHPNPFHPFTSIEFHLSHGGRTQVDVYDASGRAVRSLLDRTLSPGRWSVTWDGTTHAGAPASSGIYFCRLTTESGTATRRMTLLK
jgi:hypothetical protein